MQTSQIELRPAVAADCLRVWEWNNAPEVRAVSLSATEICYDDHVCWYRRRLHEPGTAMSIVMVDSHEVGVVRLQLDEQSESTTAMISIALSGEKRGQGMGRAAVRAACRGYFVDNPGTTIEAWVRGDNTASARCFEAAGFVLQRVAHRREAAWNIYRWQGESQ